MTEPRPLDVESGAVQAHLEIMLDVIKRSAENSLVEGCSHCGGRTDVELWNVATAERDQGGWDDLCITG